MQSTTLGRRCLVQQRSGVRCELVSPERDVAQRAVFDLQAVVAEPPRGVDGAGELARLPRRTLEDGVDLDLQRWVRRAVTRSDRYVRLLDRDRDRGDLLPVRRGDVKRPDLGAGRHAGWDQEGRGRRMELQR